MNKFVFALCLIFSVSNVFAEIYECPDGEYHLTRTCRDCPPGCYCEKSNNTGLDPEGDGEAEIYKSDVIAWCSYGKKCPWSAGGNQCGASDAATIYRCPADFPYSNGRSTKITDCYNKAKDGTKVPYAEIECKAGQYLKKGTAECAPCSNDVLEPNEYCPKGKHLFSADDNKGIETCPSGQFHSADFTECVSGIECEAGQYLPKNTYACHPCNDRASLKKNEYCPEGTFSYSKTKDSMPATCPTGQRPLTDKTGCELDCDNNEVPNKNGTACEPCPEGKYANDGKCEDIPKNPKPCPAGQYYKGSIKDCAPCVGSTRYCPGSEYFDGNSSKDQGIYDCPAGGIANRIKDACNITLSKDMMIYGPGGKTTETARQCWNMHNRISDYIKCLFGGDNIQKKPD